MATIFSWFFKGYNKVYVAVFILIIFFCYYFIGENSKLKSSNEILNTQIKDFNSESRKIVTIQNKQTKIASRPSGNRDDIHEWMRNLYEVPKK